MPEPVDPLADQPKWVKTFIYVGVLPAIVGFLLYFLTAILDARLDKIDANLVAHQLDMKILLSHLEEETEQRWVQLGISQRICLNTAKNDSDRVACVSVARRP